MVRDNDLLGKLVLSDITPAAKGKVQIEVTFEVDEDSILTVSALEKGVGEAKTLTVSSGEARHTWEKLESILEEAEKYEEVDRMYKEQSYKN